MAQSDGLVRLTILSADDGHPKGARGHELARSQQLPTAVSQKNMLRLLFAPTFFTGNLVQGLRVNPTKNRPPIIIAYCFKAHENSPVLAESFSIFLNRAVATRFWV